MEYFKDAVVNGVPLLFVVFGLVAWVKSMGLGGKALTATSFVIGIVLGILYMYSLAPLVTFSQWFGGGTFGLGLGIVASGVYKGIENATAGNLMKTPVDTE
jgi:hypothetical protein